MQLVDLMDKSFENPSNSKPECVNIYHICMYACLQLEKEALEN